VERLMGKQVKAVYVMGNGRTEKLYSGTVVGVQGTLVYLTNVKSLMQGSPMNDIAINTACSLFLQFEMQD
jgi:hypothetical protein